MTPKDILNTLTSKTSTKKEVKQDRPTIPVPDEAITAFQRLASANTIADIVESRLDVEKGIVNEILLDSFANTLFTIGTQPANPRLSVEKNNRPDIQGLFQVQTRYKLNIQEGDEELKQRVVNSLLAAGYTQAEKLVDAELDLTPKLSLRPFNELVNGHYLKKQFVPATEAEQAAAVKLIGYITGKDIQSFTESEASIVLVREDSVKVKDGFLERLKFYCNTVEDVKAVLRIITPVHFVSHIKYGVNDTPEELVQRLLTEAQKILA